MALLLPAVQSARESSRRALCISNLRQIGLAIHQYEGAHGSFPPGYISNFDPRYKFGTNMSTPCESYLWDKSTHLMLLPYLEQRAYFDSINQSVSIFTNPNLSIQSLILSVFICPSDDVSNFKRAINIPGDWVTDFYGPPPPGVTRQMGLSSYLGNYGSVDISAGKEMPNCQYNSFVLQQYNGVFNPVSPIGPSNIKDGLGNTQFFTERVVVPWESWPNKSPYYYTSGWYISGQLNDSLATNMYPINIRSRTGLFSYPKWMRTASSHHPGGVNVLMGDNSVRFVKETIDTWSFDPQTGNPLNASQTKNGDWQNLPKPGIWQALSTRGGGEIVENY